MKISTLGVAFLGLASGHEVRIGEEAANKPRHPKSKTSHGTDHNSPRVEGKQVCGEMDLRDAQCYKDTEPEIYEAAKAVVKVHNNKQWTTCTGWLVGPNNYLMTNHHCISTQEEADESEFDFMFESSNGDCSVGGERDWWAEPTKISRGAELVWADEGLDAALLKLKGNPVCEFGYYDIDHKPPVIGNHIYIPQHPRGRDKSIGITDSYTASGFCEIDRFDRAHTWYTYIDLGYDNILYTCDQEGGSSGSPVVDKTNIYMVVGINKGEYYAWCHGNIATPMNLIYPHVAGIVYNGDFYGENCNERWG